MKILFFLSFVTLTYALKGHNLHKRVLPINEKCDPQNGGCRKGDWVANRIAGCEYHATYRKITNTCDAVDDLWSWTVNVAVENTCRPISGKRFRCGDPCTNTRCVCSDTNILDFTFNSCKCQYWPPEYVGEHAPAFCTAYYGGGVSGVHHWACCNNCNDTTQKTCDGVTWQGGSKVKYCSSCGQNTGGGQAEYYFNCGSCYTQEQCKSRCSSYFVNKIPGFCWKWLECFKGCCLASASQPRNKRSISKLSFCGDSVCSENESPDSCPQDCCYKVNSNNCTSNISQCSPTCCREPQCCRDVGHSSGSNKGAAIGITIFVLATIGIITAVITIIIIYKKCTCRMKKGYNEIKNLPN